MPVAPCISRNVADAANHVTLPPARRSCGRAAGMRGPPLAWSSHLQSALGGRRVALGRFARYCRDSGQPVSVAGLS